MTAGDPKILLIASRGASGYSGLTDKSFKTFVSPENFIEKMSVIKSAVFAAKDAREFKKSLTGW